MALCSFWPHIHSCLSFLYYLSTFIHLNNPFPPECFFFRGEKTVSMSFLNVKQPLLHVTMADSRGRFHDWLPFTALTDFHVVEIKSVFFLLKDFLEEKNLKWNQTKKKQCAICRCALLYADKSKAIWIQETIQSGGNLQICMWWVALI